jgi:phosphoribulokinase
VKFYETTAAPCVAITCEAGAGEKTSEKASQKILDELPGL